MPYERPRIDFAPPAPAPGGLGDRIVNGLLYWSKQTLDYLGGPLADVLHKGFEDLLDVISDTLRPARNDVLSQLLDQPYIPDDVKTIIRTLRDEHGEAGAIIGPFILYSLLAPLVGALMQPLGNRLTQTSEHLYHSARLSPLQAADAANRKLATETWLEAVLNDVGFLPEDREFFKSLALQRISVGQTLDLLNRGEINETIAKRMITIQGYSDNDTDELIKLRFIFPGIQDTISMAVREVFDPVARARLTLDADYPDLLDKFAERIGLSSEDARNFWAAHWQLPSPTQVYEMSHRINRDTNQPLISLQDVRDYLKAADYAPVWRDLLFQLSFNPYTRVDTRRMAALGILDRQEVKNTFRDLGYDEEHAENLTAFTYAEKHAANRDLVKSDLVDGYARGIFTRQEAGDNLAEMGYDEFETNFFLDRQDYLIEKKRIEDELEIIELSYVNGLISEGDMEQRLGRLNLAETRKQRHLLEWRLAKSRKLQTPTVSQLQNFLRQEVIDEQRFRLEMDKRGYNGEYTEMFLREIVPELTPAQTMTQFKQRIISEAEFATRMTALGYTPEQIDIFVEQLTPEPTLGQLQTFFRKGAITEIEFRRELGLRGYSTQWIDAFVLSTAPKPKGG